MQGYIYFFLSHGLPFVRFLVIMAIAYPDQNAAKLELGALVELVSVHPSLVS